MSHVDEGTIHAWLDGAFAPDDPERARIEQHLAECEACRSAVEAERRIMERATGILGSAAPDAVRVEPFERILAARRARDAESAAGGAPAPAGNGTAGEGKRRGGFRIPMALAATLVLAVTATFFARQYLPNMDAAVSEPDSVLERDAVSSEAGPAAPPTATVDPSAFEDAANEAGRRTAAGLPAEPVEERESTVTELQANVVAAQAGSTAVVRSPQIPPPTTADQRNRTQEEARRLAEAMITDTIRLEALVVTGTAAPSPADETRDADAVRAIDGLLATSVAWAPADPDTVAERLGMPPLGLDGETADSTQIGTVAGASVARFVYTVDGQAVELLQWVTGSVGAPDQEAFRQQARRAEVGAAAAAGAARGDAPAKAVAPVSPAAYRLGGLDFVLRGSLPADSLVALSRRVRPGS